ncbi:hypothetical protein SLEP1_g20459 [Rubroshorea leprosula]|uniref:Uncharacterized protein n=1 Tax=Rubroshorea leprosula TaxID=152421 RepID=A0AAV5J2T7_9ROSI|nr:hypothetical protein SLEP1_g20459 [Rubroshorea leprosula]
MLLTQRLKQFLPGIALFLYPIFNFGCSKIQALDLVLVLVLVHSRFHAYDLGGTAITNRWAKSREKPQ